MLHLKSLIHEYQKMDAAAGFGIWDITFGWFYSELGETNRVAGWVRNAVQYGHAPVGIERLHQPVNR